MNRSSPADQRGTQGEFRRWFPRRWIEECARRYVEYHAHAHSKIRAAAIIGVLGFPGFYFIWAYVIPQPYESVLLRGIGTACCLVLATTPFWRPAFQKYVVPLSYITFLYCLPFFFTLMQLLNGSNPVWQMSNLSALIYVVLLYDLVNAIIVVITGSLAAILTFVLMSGGAHIPDSYWTAVPILVFALAGFIGLAYGDNLIAREKLKAAASLASQVAHEVRTPLAGIRFETEGSQRLLANLPGDAIRDRLRASNARVRQHISAANSVIDLLLFNVAQHHNAPLPGELHMMGQVVSSALDRYHFKASERGLIQTALQDDFLFRGSDLLMTHVLFNLFKNGFRAMEARGGEKNAMRIELRRGHGMNSLTISDTGEGIPAEMLNYVFIPFVSGQRSGGGTGLGLSFCRMVVESFGGTITCQSERNVGTTFTIRLPVAPDQDKQASNLNPAA
jgi:two-component system CAI-1 autoinducer sensor kinase/phosphatase CqsS